MVSSNNKADVPLSFNPSAFLTKVNKVVNLTTNLLHTLLGKNKVDEINIHEKKVIKKGKD